MNANEQNNNNSLIYMHFSKFLCTNSCCVQNCPSKKHDQSFKRRLYIYIYISNQCYNSIFMYLRIVYSNSKVIFECSTKNSSAKSFTSGERSV